MALGTGIAYSLTFDQSAYKTAGAHVIALRTMFYIGNPETRDNPARVAVASDNAGASVLVDGWYIRALKRY